MNRIPVFNAIGLDEFARRRSAISADAQAHTPTWNVDSAGGVGTLHIYGAIGGFWGDVSAADIVPQIRALDVATLNVFINSPGGDVYEGIAIRNALRNHPANVIVTVDGLAASAASYIACSGDEVIMSENSELMIHDAWTIAIGDADEFREAADMLDRISDNIAGMYAAKAGGTADEWRALMRAETWYSAQEAVDAGLADRLDSDTAADDAAAAAKFNLSMFAHAGRAAAQAPIPAAAMAAPRKENRMNRAQLLAALKAGIITQDQYDTEVGKLEPAPAPAAGSTEPAPVAVAAGRPGEAVAAEYAAGPQNAPKPAAPAHTQDRPASLASIMPELLDAAKRDSIVDFVATVNNALETVTAGDDTGEAFLQPERIGQVWQATPGGRPVISSLGAVRPLTSNKIEGWKWTLPTPAPEAYAGDLAEIPSDEWQTVPVTENADRWAKGNRIDRIYTDLGSADLIASLFAILDANYEGVSDSKVFADLVAGATLISGGASTLLRAITKSYLQLKKIGAAPSKFWMAEDVFLDFAELKVADLPAWLANSSAFVKLDGNASLSSVFDVDVNFDLPNGGFVAYDQRAATVYESAKIKLEAQAIANGGIDLGWFAYGGTLIGDPRALVKATVGIKVFTLQITGGPTGGTFTLSVNGKVSGAIAYNADAATVQTAINAIDDGITGITVTGGGTKTITFPEAVELTGSGASLTGGASPAVVIAAA